MEWQIIFIIIVLFLFVFFASGVPIAFCFLGLNLLGGFFILGGSAGLHQLMLLLIDSLWNWSLLPLPMFIIMGEVMVRSGILPSIIETIDKWIGRIPGRLSLLTVAVGAVFATLSGSSVSGYALLGSTLTPEMEKRGYKPEMSVGPILGSGGLAMMIPPSIMAVLLASLAEFSSGKILIAIIVPGLMMALAYIIYIVLRCRIQPSVAPPYAMPSVPLANRLVDLARYVLPLAFIVFAVTGVIFLGMATPTEASATGALAAIILVACHGKLNWHVLKETMIGSIDIIGMVLLIIMSAMAFSQILAFSGVTTGMIEFATSFPVSPLALIAIIIVVLLVMGCFMDAVTIMMIAVPVVYPVIYAMDFDPVWFGVMMLLTVEMGMISPPFGMGLFVMQGVVSEKVTTGDIYISSLPFFAINCLLVVLILFFPILTQWLPGMMR